MIINPVYNFFDYKKLNINFYKEPLAIAEFAILTNVS
jgi:hypothetical protein